MKKILKLLPILVISLFLSACSSVSVTTDYDKTVDFTQIKTFEYYGWAAESDKILNDLDKRRIESAFGDEFKKRGMQLVESGGDVIVALFIMTQDKTQYNATTTGAGYGGYYGYGPGYGWGGGHSTTTINEYDYEVGTLVCDVFDKKKEVLIWEGIGTKTIVENPEKREVTIPKAVKAIMSKFPVAPK